MAAVRGVAPRDRPSEARSAHSWIVDSLARINACQPAGRAMSFTARTPPQLSPWSPPPGAAGGCSTTISRLMNVRPRVPTRCVESSGRWTGSRNAENPLLNRRPSGRAAGSALAGENSGRRNEQKRNGCGAELQQSIRPVSRDRLDRAGMLGLANCACPEHVSSVRTTHAMNVPTVHGWVMSRSPR